MLDSLNLEKVLFLDIETVPEEEVFKDLDEEFKELWERKIRFYREREGVDLEDSYGRAGLYSEFGKIICISVGFFASAQDKREFRLKSFYGKDEHNILTEFGDLVTNHFSSSQHVLCAHNGKAFDFPFIARRMLINEIKLPETLDLGGKKPWEIQHLDTMSLWKFGDYKYFTSIRLLTKILKVPGPKSEISGGDIARIFYEENDLEKIVKYCKKDVLAVAQVILKFKGEELLNENEIVQV